MKIVGDKLVLNDESDKRKGYNLKDGGNTLKTGLVSEVTAKRGRVWSKKTMKNVENKRENLIHCFETLSHCGIVLSK
jgi:hypothetical protein